MTDLVDPLQLLSPADRPRSVHGDSFRDYVMRRKYDFGRGSRDAWRFIAFARGDADFPDPKSWRELEAYLLSSEPGAEFAATARSVWRSFTAFRSRVRSASTRRRAEAWP